MIFKPNTNIEEIYPMAIKVLSSLPPFSSLREREREVFGWLLSHYWNNPMVKKSKDGLYDQYIKQNICDKLGINMPNIYTIIHDLRKKGILTTKGINPKYIFTKNQLKTITFDFNIQ